VSDYFPNASSCRAYADKEFGPETLQMQAFRLRLLTVAASSRSAYGDGAGVVAVALKPSVVSDVGLGLSSGVGVGVASDFGLAPCPAP
jgi:hypothetical protein